MQRNSSCSSAAASLTVEEAPEVEDFRTRLPQRPFQTLGMKRAAIFLRRQGRAANVLASVPLSSDRVLLSNDMTLAFALTHTSDALVVKRLQGPSVDRLVVQLMMFDDVETFDRWCQRETTRFDEPLLFARVKDAGHDLFALS